MDWPVCAGFPFLFLAYINLAETAPYNAERFLPPSGFLNFFMKDRLTEFGDPAGNSRWRVLYRDARPEELPLARRRFDLETQYLPRPVSFGSRPNIPPLESTAVRALGLTAAERGRYQQYEQARNRQPSPAATH